jgi:glycine cleavage system transcriptional repressor
MTLLAVTVLGHDRPGIIAQTTAALAGLGLNLEDSTMTLLRGHFAFMLVCSGDGGRDAVEAALAPLAADGTLAVSVRTVAAEDLAPSRGVQYQLAVHGADRPGIVSALTGALADVGGNVTDLSTRLAGHLYVLLAEVDLPATTDVPALQARIAEVAQGLGVDAALRAVEPDLL